MDLGIKKVGDRIRIQQSLKKLRIKEARLSTRNISDVLKELDSKSLSPFISNPTPLPGHHSTAPTAPTSRNHSPQDSYFTAQPHPSSTRYPVVSKTSQNVPNAPKFSLSAPASASETRTQTQTATDKSTDNVNNILSMDLVKQNTVRFIYGQGATKSAFISGCFNGSSIKRKALRKIGIKDLSENWVVFISDNEHGKTTRQVSDLELVTICHSQDRSERNRLMFCAAGSTPSPKQLDKSQQILLENIAKSTPPPPPPPPPQQPDRVSNNDYNDNAPISSGYPTDNAKTLTPTTSNQISIHSNNSKDGTIRSNESAKRRLRKFYGQRPPSELISNNLKEYFPEVGPAVLKETIRNSIIYKRMSRMSRVSQRSSIASAWDYQEDDEVVPPMPSVDSLIPPGSLSHELIRLSNASLGSSFSLSKLIANSPLGNHDFSTASVSNDDRPQTSAVDAATNSATKLSISIKPEDEELSDEEEVLNMPANFEEEFMDAFNQERSGPSRWIQGTFIGSGSFGTVYLGMNSVTGELMAVKQVELPTGNKETEQKRLTMIDALQREMNLLRDLQHENIVQYLGSNSEGNFLNIFLEYVPGGSVATMLTNYGAFEESLIRNFVRQILQGLKYLHDRNIIHRDIKGANVLVDNKGGIKISDFGISKKVDPRLLSSESSNHGNNRVSLQGSVYWMAPEVVKQTSYTLKADIWSLGCLIIEMFTGTHPFPEFSQMQAIFKIGTSVAPAIPTDCSTEAQTFLKQTFEIDYHKRPTSEELLKEPFLKPLL